MSKKYNIKIPPFDQTETSEVGGDGSGDVVGPSSATNLNISVFDGTTGKLIKDGGKTISEVLDRANHTGTQASSTISDFDTEVSNNANVSANTTHITSNGSDHTYIDQDVTSGATPTFTNTNFTEATNKNYVTDAEKTVIGNTSGTNTGDQSASDFNHDDLSAITGTAGQYNHPTDAQITVLGNTSGTNTGDESSATTSAEGIAELATTSEVNTGTDTGRVVTPDALSGSVFGEKVFQLKIIDDATDLTIGDGKLHFFITPDLNGMNLVDADAGVSTASTSGTPEVQVYNVTDSVDMLSTTITIDANEKTSYTASTPPVIDTANDDVATGDELRIDVDTAGTGAKGLTVFLTFRLP